MKTHTCDICGKDYPASNRQCNSCNDKSQHTPTLKLSLPIIQTMLEERNSDKELAKDHAAFIVKAVNSHDELVEALKSVLDTIESYNQVKNVFNLNSAQWKKAKQALKNAE